MIMVMVEDQEVMLANDMWGLAGIGGRPDWLHLAHTA